MKICYLPTYEPGYSRVKIIKDALELNKIEVIDCSSRLQTQKRHSFLRYVDVFLKFITKKNQADIILVGFFGQPLIPFIKLFTRKKIVLDAYMSMYNTLIEDKKVIKKDSWKSKLLYHFEKWTFNLSDKVLLDTKQHINYCCKIFNLDPEKFNRVFIGADDTIFFPRKIKKSNKKFKVLFHGRYVPLQGTKYIVEAAKILENKDVCFELIGSGQTFKDTVNFVREINVRNIRFIKPLPVKEISKCIDFADVCLGIFGNTKKASLVIPNKAYEVLAKAKPLITAKTPATDELLKDGVNALLCKPANGKSLAECILLLKNNPRLKGKIARNGYNLFIKKCSPKKIGEELVRILKKL